MTIPKAFKYRVRRDQGKATAPKAAAPLRAGSDDAIFAPVGDGFDPSIFPPKGKQSTSEENLADVQAELTAIEAEGLSARQLRLARRIGRKYGIEADTEVEVVRLLRKRGIDPFDRTLLLAGDSAPPPQVSGTALTPRSGQALDKVRPADVGAAQMAEGQRAREVIRIQRDIARRRRRKLALLAARLAFFVFLPTIIAGYYFYAVATPMYATESQFVIQKADGMNSGSMGGLFSGTQFATSQDSITVQGYLQSRDAMLRLDREEGFARAFEQPDIDVLQRLPADATMEDIYKIYSKNVKIGYDPTEGIIRMQVVAPTPQDSQKFSDALINYAEDQVDDLTARMRTDQMQGALETYRDAEAKVDLAQQKVLELQQKLGVLDPVSENSLAMAQIGNLQTQLAQKRLELDQLLDNANPNTARVNGARGDITRLEQMIAQERSRLTASLNGNESLAAVTGQLQIAAADLQTRQQLLAAAAEQMEAARIEANKQVRYLETSVKPVAPDMPTFPRSFEDTILAFLVFSGIYLMLSLTASVLREQVSS